MNFDISTMRLELHESKFKEENTSIIFKVLEKLEEISTKDRSFLKLMDAEAKK